MLFIAWILSAAWSPSRAATDEAVPDTADGPQQPAPFGHLSSAVDVVGPARVPVDQQALRETGSRSLIPPRTDRSAWQPRLATTLDADDNLLLTSSDHRRGTALVLAPGANWLSEGPRHRVELDASAELLRGIEGDYDGSRLDASTVQASASAATSPTTTVRYLGTLLRSHDPAGTTPAAPVATGTADQRFASSYQLHDLEFDWRTDHRTDLSARWSGTWADSRSPDFVRTRAQDVELAIHWQTDPLLRLSATVRERSARFDDRPDARHDAAWLGAEMQWSRTLLGSAALGATRGTEGTRLALWRAALTQSFSRGQWILALERDVTVPPGLGLMYETRSARIGAQWRVGQRSSIEASLVGAQYRPLGAAPGAGSVRTWRPRLSYTLPCADRTWLNFRYQGIDDQVDATGVQRRGNRLLATILRTF